MVPELEELFFIVGDSMGKKSYQRWRVGMLKVDTRRKKCPSEGSAVV